jgi:hypothetical protein
MLGLKTFFAALWLVPAGLFLNVAREEIPAWAAP